MFTRRWIVVAAAVAVGACSDSTGPEVSARLVFETEPVAVGAGASFAPPVSVSVRDRKGMLVTDWTGKISLSLEGPGAVGLEGVTSLVPDLGLATFTDLVVPDPGDGYRLVAASPGVEDVRSDAFGVPGGFQAASVTAGSYHTCALDGDGRAWCWGDNTHGQLGDGSTQDRGRPTAVSTDVRFATLEAEGTTTCGMTSGGVVYCWGWNNLGAVGVGTEGTVTSPQAVTLPAPAKQLAVGYVHTCALLEGGEAYCWGDNAQGVLGTGSAEPVVRVPEPVSGDLTFSSLSAGFEHVCGLTPSGEAYCWGRNTYGELGDGTQSVPRAAPTRVLGDEVFTELVAGGGPCHGETCGITPDGRVLCWGKNYQQRFPDSPEKFLLAPTPLVDDPGFVAVLPAPMVLCGLTASHELYCMGDPENGQLGNGSTVTVRTPTRVMAGRTVTSVAVGWEHVCAVTSAGAAWCWGSNAHGQLGNGSNPLGWMVPVPVWAPGS